MFKVTLRLTKDGFDNYRAVSSAVFKYLSLLRSSQFPAWYQKELATIKETRFRFAEKRRPEDYALWVTEQLSHPMPRDQVLSASQLISEWDAADPMKEGGGEKEMRDMLDMLRVTRGRSVLMARKDEHERLNGGEKKWQQEPWYGTGYTVEKYDEVFVKEVNDLSPACPTHLLKLIYRRKGPTTSKSCTFPVLMSLFLHDLMLISGKLTRSVILQALSFSGLTISLQPSKRPHLIRQTPLTTLWHKKDDQFWVPRAQVIVDIRR